MRTLVTGAGGMLAHDLVPRLGRAGHDVVAADRTQLDITDAAACAAAVAGVELVVNCAAFTAVDDAETREAEAFAVNAVGAGNLAGAAERAGASLVHISTDYVFDGVGPSDGHGGVVPYAEDAPVGPRSAYGRTKAAGEWAVRALCERTWVLRTAWLYGAGGGNFVATMARLAGEHATLSVVDDQHGQPTWTGDVADAVVRLAHARAPYGVYHATSRGETTWFGLTRALFEELGLDPQRVRPVTTAEFPRPAPRPAWSVLGHDAWGRAGLSPLPDWRESLRRNVREVVPETPAEPRR